jgi:predicted RNA-binding protein with PUA-like domain
MWLLKTEPSEYGYAELERDGRAVWDGVTNPVALRNLLAMRAGERVLVYHTGGERAVVGVARVTREAYPDPKAGNPRLVVVEITAVGRLRSAVPLARIKALPEFALSPLVRQGRLSVVPLTEAQWRVLEREGRA